MPKVTSRTKTKKVRVSKKSTRKKTRGRPCKDPNDRMKLISISLPTSMIESVDSMLEDLSATQPFFEMSRSSLIRACLKRVLDNPEKFFSSEK